MIRHLLAIVLLALATCQPCHAGYTVHTDSQRQEFATVNGPAGPQLWRASAEAPAVPTLGQEICRPDNYSIFAADQERRTRVFRDSLGVANLADILSACPQLREQRAKLVRAEGARRLKALTPYSAAERDTWPQQQAEAREYRADGNCPCPMIREIASRRGISLGNLVEKIEENVAIFSAASGAILGEQQKLLHQIDAAQDIDTLLGVTWN